MKKLSFCCVCIHSIYGEKIVIQGRKTILQEYLLNTGEISTFFQKKLAHECKYS